MIRNCEEAAMEHTEFSPMTWRDAAGNIYAQNELELLMKLGSG